jgi:hypothetical protein
MDARHIFLGIVIVLLLTGLSGCEEQGVTTENNFENVYLDSNLVRLVYANLSFDERREINDELEPVMVKKQVNLEYLFENIAGRDIIFNVTVEFYDDNDLLIKSIRPVPWKNINLPEGHIETISMKNEASYAGEKVKDISYARIVIQPMSQVKF